VNGRGFQIAKWSNCERAKSELEWGRLPDCEGGVGFGQEGSREAFWTQMDMDGGGSGGQRLQVGGEAKLAKGQVGSWSLKVARWGRMA